MLLQWRCSHGSAGWPAVWTALRANAFSAHDLEYWEFDVLAALRRSGPPYRLSPGQLMQETLVTSGTMTNRVDRLTARGFVARQDHPDDRRGVLVQLTEAGKDVVDAALAELLAAERADPGRAGCHGP